MARAHLLIPTTCEHYLYDHTVIGTLSAPSGSFKWNGHDIPTDRIPEWTMVSVKGDTPEEANRYARYQADRIMSGMHPCYIAEA